MRASKQRKTARDRRLARRPRHRRLAGGRDDDGLEAHEFLLKQSDSISSAAPRDELLQTSSASPPPVCAGPRCRSHLIEVDLDAAPRGLPGRLAAGQTPPKIVDRCVNYVYANAGRSPVVSSLGAVEQSKKLGSRSAAH